MTDGCGISSEIALRWTSRDDKSTLVQGMAWCHQATTITWANVDPDLCCHMASLGHNELKRWRMVASTLWRSKARRVVPWLETLHKPLLVQIMAWRRPGDIWTNAGIYLSGHLGTNFSEILIESYIFLLKKMHPKMLSAKLRPFCLSLNVLRLSIRVSE